MLIVLLRAGWTAVMAVVPRNGSARQLAPRELAEMNSEAPAHPGRQSRPGHDRRRKSLLHGASRPNGSTPAMRRGQAAASPLTGVILQTFQRWWFELFFKWIKQHLRIKQFFGTSENAVKTQIWIAVSVYVLVAIVKKRLKLEASLYTLLQVLSVTLFEKLPLDQTLTHDASKGVTSQITN
jgi:hypothetical protein